MFGRSITIVGDHATSRLVPVSWLFFGFCLLVPMTICWAQDGRADLPPNNSLRIENRRGNVTVEVWTEQHVSVTATFEGVPPKRSPVIIRRTDQLLNVIVAKDATLKEPGQVNLTLRVPPRSRIEITTIDSEVEVRGLPAMLSVQTQGGDIRTALPSNSSADIIAQSSSGKVDSVFPLSTAASNGGHRFHVRIGTGSIPVRLSSRTGQIALSNLETAREPVEVAVTGGPPKLAGTGDGAHPAGTPATSSSDPQEIDEGDIVRVDTELVTLNVTVVDRATSRGLTDLAKNDFKIFEDGVEQQIGHFESSAAPFNLILLIDVSDSTKDKLDLIRLAAQHFVDAARPADSIAVIAFANSPEIVSPLTSDRSALRQRISTMKSAPGTKLYDSIQFVLTDILKDAGRLRRTAVVVMSDGLDGSLPSVTGDGSALSYPEVLSQVREFDGVLYSLWVDTEYESLSDKDTQPEDFDAGHDRMEEIADAGGGLFYEVAKLEDLADAYERVAADIGTVYSLSYRPGNEVRDGKWRSIRVKVERPDAVARGKSGYYAK